MHLPARAAAAVVTVGAAAAVVSAGAGVAAAQPAPPPPPPNVNALTPVSPADYAVLDGAWYAFATPEGATCVLQRNTGGFGCSGQLPGAPNGANMVSGGPGGIAFVNAGSPPFAVAGEVRPLEPGTRLSYRDVSCGVDGATTTCVNAYDQTGFVIGPGGSFLLNDVPLLARPDGNNPFAN